MAKYKVRVGPIDDYNGETILVKKVDHVTHDETHHDTTFYSKGPSPLPLLVVPDRQLAYYERVVGKDARG